MLYASKLDADQPRWDAFGKPTAKLRQLSPCLQKAAK